MGRDEIQFPGGDAPAHAFCEATVAGDDVVQTFGLDAVEGLAQAVQ